MANDVAVFEKQLAEASDKWRPVLPPAIDADRFQSTVVTAVARNPQLLTVDRQSLLMAAFQAAQDGLLPDGREGVIAIFSDYKTKKKMAQWMPMVAGILRRCREKGDLTAISAYCVYEADKFEVILGDNPQIIHKPYVGADRGDVVAAYAIFRNGDEVLHREIMTREEIDQTRGVSRAREGTAWTAWFGEMARKTVIRRGAKSLPLSADVARIIERDDQWVDFSLANKPGMRDIAEVDDNPLNDAIVINGTTNGAVEEEASLYEQLLCELDACQSRDELDAFHKINKERLQALDAPDLGKIRARYRARQKELRTT